ncbi:MAG: ABC transporter permease [Mediterranea sp.]|nr:ABC transporter permease [Mediterranea sp.]
MNLARHLALRIYRGEEGEQRQASRPVVVIAMAGIAIGVAVMLISVAVVIGFKQEVRGKIVGFSSHITVMNQRVASAYDSRPVVTDDSLMALFSNCPQVKHAQRFSLKAGMIKTQDAFQGMVLKGVGPEYDRRFLWRHLVEGECPQFSDSASTNRVVISRLLADKLRLKVGDKLDTYFLDEQVRARRLQVVGIYCTNFADFDRMMLFTDLCTVNRLNRWHEDQSSGMEVEVRDYEQLDETTFALADQLAEHTDRYGQRYVVVSVEQLNPQMFAWLGILDVNIWVILFLMVGVAGFTMVSGLLIIIIERTAMIGLLKSLGASNLLLRKLFLWLSVFLIGRGMLWGNVVALLLIFAQRWLGLFTLDPETYYMDTVPMALPWGYFLLINLGAFVASVLMLVGPSYLIARIHPATSMRYE